MINRVKSAIRIMSHAENDPSRRKPPHYSLEIYAGAKEPQERYVVTEFLKPEISRDQHVIDAFKEPDYKLVALRKQRSKELIGKATCKAVTHKAGLHLINITVRTRASSK